MEVVMKIETPLHTDHQLDQLAGQLGDDMDYVEWASLVQMAENLEKRLRLLSGEASG
jgi:hypothetical protein